MVLTPAHAPCLSKSLNSLCPGPSHPSPSSSQDDDSVCGTQFLQGCKALKGLLIFRGLGLCSAVMWSINCFIFLKASQEQILTWGRCLPWLITEKAGSGSVQVRMNEFRVFRNSWSWFDSLNFLSSKCSRALAHKGEVAARPFLSKEWDRVSTAGSCCPG